MGVDEPRGRGELRELHHVVPAAVVAAGGEAEGLLLVDTYGPQAGGLRSPGPPPSRGPEGVTKIHT